MEVKKSCVGPDHLGNWGKQRPRNRLSRGGKYNQISDILRLGTPRGGEKEVGTEEKTKRREKRRSIFPVLWTRAKEGGDEEGRARRGEKFRPHKNTFREKFQEYKKKDNHHLIVKSSCQSPGEGGRFVKGGPSSGSLI